MKRILYILSALSITLMPVGFAFAQEWGTPPPPHMQPNTSNEQRQGPGPAMMGEPQNTQQGEYMMGGQPGDVQQGENRMPPPPPQYLNQGSSTDASSTPGRYGMPWMRGIKRGIEAHFGTTTPPGFFMHASSSDAVGSSSPDHRGWLPPVPGFLQWLFFGKQSSTTQSQQQLPPPPQNQPENNTSSSTQPQQQLPGPASFWNGFFGRLKTLF